ADSMCLREKIGPDPRNFNQRVSLGRNDLLIRTFLKLLSAQDRAFIYEFARMIFAYINDKSIEILLLSCFAAADQKAIQRYIPQAQDGEDFRNHLQYKLTLPTH
ncbi:TPA: hypothetical protein ACG1NE_004334, partial [Escherichia coli]